MQYFKRYLPFYPFYGASHTSYLLTFLPLLHSRWRILLPIAYTYLIHDRTKFQKFKPNLLRTAPISLVFPWKRVRTSDTPTRLPPIHSTSSTKTLSILHFHYLIYLYYLYYLYLSYLLTKMQITTFKYFDNFFKEDPLDAFDDDDTVEAGNQDTSTALRLVLQIKVSSNSILDTQLADAKATLENTLGTSVSFLPWDTHPSKYLTAKGVKAVPSKEKLKYLKGYKVFSDANAQDRTVYIRFLLRFKDAEISKDFLDDICQENLNDFTSSAAGGWITNLRLASCTSNATQPCILCLLINVSQEYEDSEILVKLLQDLTGDITIGLKFATYNGPKTLAKKISSGDWTLKKVLQVEKSTKAIESYFKRNLLLGSRVEVVNTSKSKWASSSKGKKAYIEGMNTQIALNDRLLSYDLDDANVFALITVGSIKKYILDAMMSLKSKTPVMVRGEARYGPVFHSCCPKGAQETTFYFPASTQQQAESIIDGFPLFLRQCFRINPSKVCRSALIASVDGGTFDEDTYTYTAPGHQNNILEFIDIAPPTASETFLSTVEHNAMARTADDMTAETNLRQDDISALSGGTENTITLRQQVKAMAETAALQAQRIRDLEAAQTSPAASLETPKHNKRGSQATDITPGEDEHTGRVEEMEDDRGGYESPTAEKDEDDSFVDASENAHSEFAGADEEEEAEESPQQTIELSGDEESEESSEDEDYIPQSPKSPPARRSSATNKRTSSQRSPKTTAAVQGRRTSRRRNGAAPKYNE